MAADVREHHQGRVAVVGIGCRFPGGIADAASFWRFLAEGRDAIAEIPRDRIDLGHYYDARPATPGRIMTRWGGFLGRIDEFDAAFFRMSPREAERLDPQQRLLLETAWEALEDAGQNVSALEGSPTGVFVGQWLSDFEARLFADPEAVDFYMTTGSGRYASSGRLSYLLGLRGPSLTIDTACSSSLVAVHMAVRSIRSGECALALAGGANVILQPHISVAYSQSRMMAPDGRCKFGDASGDGYVRSEGAGLVVLKSLAAARAAGDRIYAVIHGSAVNNDGHSSGSMGTPSRVGQEELLRTAYRDAGVPAGKVGYIEAHGTGTRAGDPVELGALSNVLSEGRESGSRARVGSVKTNFGHTEGAAGIAGLMKAALCLYHQAIPASLHCKQLNPAVAWAEAPVEIARAPVEWHEGGANRLAGVSAFGIAGTNAHVVLGGASPVSAPPVPDTERAHVLVLSARSAESLKGLAAAYLRLLEGSNAPPLADLCSNAAIHRTPLEHRAAFSAASNADLQERLRRFVAGEQDAAHAVGEVDGVRTRLVAFVFPGQGSQWVGMARELAEREPAFAAVLDRCEEAMRPWVDWSLREQLLANEGAPEWRMGDIAVIQPVLLAVEIAFGELWRSLGVEPDAVVGHSMGEAGAAYFAGAISLEDAMAVICCRSALMRKTSGRGAMAVVELGFEELKTRLTSFESQVTVAVSNAPRSSVMSGEPAVIKEILAQLERDGIFARPVKVDVASHSPQMDPLVPELVGALSGVRPRTAAVDLYSTVFARKIDGAEMDARYWGRNLRQPVLFGATVEALIAAGIDTFIELSPHPLLLGAVAQVSQSLQRPVLALQSTRRQEPERQTLLASLGALFVAGHPVQWRRLYPAVRRVDLPKYPWQRERFWLAELDQVSRGRVTRASTGSDPAHPLLGEPMDLAASDLRVWECSLDTGRVTFAGDHVLHGAPVLSAAALVEIFLAAGLSVLGTDRLEVADVSFERALYLESPGKRSTLQVRAVGAASGAALTVEIFSRHEEQWLRHAHGSVRALPADTEPGVFAFPSPLLAEQGGEIDAAGIYPALERAGVRYGEQLRGTAALRRTGASITAELRAAAGADTAGCVCAPALLEGLFQVAVLTAPEFERQSVLVMPRSLARLRYFGSASQTLRVELQRASGSRVDLIARDDSGAACLDMSGLRLEPAGAAAPSDPEQWLHELTWQAGTNSASRSQAGRWLLMTGTGTASREFAQGVARKLHESGGSAQILAPAPDSTAQLERLRQQAGAWQAVVHCAAWDAADNEQLTSADLVSAPLPGGPLLLDSLRSLDASPWEGAPRLWIVTRGARQVTPEDRGPAVAQGPLYGLACALVSELPDRFGALIDLDGAATPDSQATQLVDEVLGYSDEPTVALRTGGRYVARLASLAVPSAGMPTWRADGTCLLTGGLGGVGLHIARWLVARGARRLLITGRTPLPPRAEWSSLVGEAARTRVEKLKELESLGAEVHYVALDAADPGQVGALLVRWKAEGRPPIRSVFHAAGITEDRLLAAQLSPDSVSRVFAPKAAAAWTLHELCADVEHFVLFSSVASVWANAGQGSYAAANAFLDSLAHHRRSAGKHALSVSWGVWADTGFGATEGGRQARARLEQDGLFAFDPTDALVALSAALASGRSHVAVLRADWTRWASNAEAARAVPPLLRGLVPVGNALTKAAPAAERVFLDELRAAAPDRRKELLEERVARHVSSILKLPGGRLDPRKPLGSYGLDSIMAIELRNRLERDVALPLSATLIWNYPTVVALAGLLAGKLAPAESEPATVVGAPTLATAPVSASTTDPAQPGERVRLEVETLSDDDALAALRASRGRRK